MLIIRAKRKHATSATKEKGDKGKPTDAPIKAFFYGILGLCYLAAAVFALFGGKVPAEILTIIHDIVLVIMAVVSGVYVLFMWLSGQNKQY